MVLRVHDWVHDFEPRVRDFKGTGYLVSRVRVNGFNQSMAPGT